MIVDNVDILLWFLTFFLQSWRIYFEGMEKGGEEVMDENYFNQPTIVLSSGNLKNNASAGLVSWIVSSAIAIIHISFC